MAGRAGVIAGFLSVSDGFFVRQLSVGGKAKRSCLRFPKTAPIAR